MRTPLAGRRIPSPSEGAGSGRRTPLRPLRLGLALAALAGAGTAQPEARCDVPPEPGLAYSLDLDARRDASATHARVTFRLLRAAAPREVAGLLFADGVQVLGPDTVRTVACGETAAWNVRLPRPAGTPLDLHASVDTAPTIPRLLETRLPTPEEAYGLAYHPNDVARRAFGPAREPPPNLASAAAERRPARVAEAYLYDDDPDRPRHVRVLPPGERRWSFGVLFGETARRDGAFAITCLLDGRQFDAFDGRPLWYGRLDAGEAARIPARTPPLAPGWHEVRCLALDDLFAGPEPGPAWPYVIRSAFVHRGP